ncbi:MAG: response regulator transcription factor [Opitutaceae bacterium]
MKIVIVEDHQMYRDVFRKICEQECRFAVVGEASDAQTAIALVHTHKPDFVLLDIGLKGIDGFAVVEAAAQTVLAPRTLVVSAHLTEYIIDRCERHRVSGFLDKNHNNVTTLPPALFALARGQTYFSPSFQAAKLAWRQDPRSIAKRLSNTEQTILSLITHGMTDEQIANRMGRSPKTVQLHRSNILRRLEMPGTPKLMAYAMAKGFGPLR